MECLATLNGVINPERPRQGLRDLEKAGLRSVLLDYDLYAQLGGYGGEKYRPERYRREYDGFVETLRESGVTVSAARMPFPDPLAKLHFDDVNDVLLRVSRDCIRAGEDLGCRNLIVQPLYRGLNHTQAWEVNRAYFLELARGCGNPETRILLTNLCREQGGHLVRGICSDAVTAAEWVDELNCAVGRERFGFCLDVGNCNLCGQDVAYMVSVLGDRLKAVLLSENDGIHAAKRLPFTDNRTDWLGIIRGLRQMRFDGQLLLDAGDTLGAFSPLMKPALLELCRSMMDYFDLQIGIEKVLKRYDRIVLFGAGNMCRNYMKCYGQQYPPLYTCDNNPKLWGTTFEGLEIHDPADLKDLPEGCGVIICNMYYREIEAQLREMGITEVGFFNDEFMPSFYFDRLERED